MEDTANRKKKKQAPRSRLVPTATHTSQKLDSHGCSRKKKIEKIRPPSHVLGLNLQANKAIRHCFFYILAGPSQAWKRPNSSFRVATQATKVKKKKMKKPGPLLCWMVCLLQEGPRKDKSKLKPQQSNKPFSLWQEAMIPHFFILKSLLAWLLAFFLFATCNDSSSFPRPVSFAQVKRKKEQKKWKKWRFVSILHLPHMLALTLLLFHCPRPFTLFFQLATPKRKQTKPKRHLYIFF